MKKIEKRADNHANATFESGANRPSHDILLKVGYYKNYAYYGHPSRENFNIPGLREIHE